jgi:hypothetical protein
MDCQQIQDQLFAADSYTAEALPSELKAHVRGCAECRHVLSRLMRLEKATRMLGEPDSSLAQEAFLRELQPMRLVGANRSNSGRSSSIRAGSASPGQVYQPRGNWGRLAMAASVLICVAGGLVAVVVLKQHHDPATGPAMARSNPSSTQPARIELAMASPASPLVSKLVDWNVDLAEADSAEERAEINDEAATLREEVQKELEGSNLSPEDRELADKLMKNGTWLVAHTESDPLAEAERFEDIADKLLDRTQAAAFVGDTNSAGVFGRHYSMVSATGINAKLEKAQKDKVITPEEKRRLERMVKSNSDLKLKLQRLLDQSPAAARKAIDKALHSDGSKPAHHGKPQPAQKDHPTPKK